MTKRRPFKHDYTSPLADEVRHGRNFVRAGDGLRFQLQPGGRWWPGVFIGAESCPSGVAYWVRDLRTGGTRMLRPERVKRTTKAVTR